MKQEKLKLILPSGQYVASYLKALAEFAAEGTNVAEGPHRIRILQTVKDWPKYQKVLREERKGINIPKDRVPSTLYWAIVGKKIVGRVSLRHRLNKNLKIVGGHIGYAVVPSERRKGYATEMLRLALKKARALGIKKVLVTCDQTNLASKRVIEKNGGVYEGKAKNPEKLGYTLRFWIG